MTQLVSLEGVLEDQLQDIYSAESQILKAIPRMAEAAGTPSLKSAFKEHVRETEGQLKRLEQIASQRGIKLGGKTCKGMKGLIAEGEEALEMEGDAPLIDLALIAAAQRVEHYEISAYGTALALAEQEGDAATADLLRQTLGEEQAADKKLTALVETQILPPLKEELKTADDLVGDSEQEELEMDEEEDLGLVEETVDDEQLAAGEGEAAEGGEGSGGKGIIEKAAEKTAELIHKAAKKTGLSD